MNTLINFLIVITIICTIPIIYTQIRLFGCMNHHKMTIFTLCNDIQSQQSIYNVQDMQTFLKCLISCYGPFTTVSYKIKKYVNKK